LAIGQPTGKVRGPAAPWIRSLWLTFGGRPLRSLADGWSGWKLVQSIFRWALPSDGLPVGLPLPATMPCVRRWVPSVALGRCAAWRVPEDGRSSARPFSGLGPRPVRFAL